jgi:hypothetical protein
MINKVKIKLNNQNISNDTIIWIDIYERFFTHLRIPLKIRKKILNNCMLYNTPFYTVKGDVLIYEISDWVLQKIENEYNQLHYNI